MTAKEKKRAQGRAWREGPRREQILAEKKAYYAKHCERQLAQQKSKREADKERFYEHRRKLYAANRARRNEQQRQWYAADRRRRLERNRQYRAEHLDVFLEREKNYRTTHQTKHYDHFRARMKQAGDKRRALKLGAFVEAVDPATVFRRDKGVCGICRKKVDQKSKWHVDHIVPLAKGWMHAYVNVQLSHARCNWSKQAKLPNGQLGLFQKAAT